MKVITYFSNSFTLVLVNILLPGVTTPWVLIPIRLENAAV